MATDFWTDFHNAYGKASAEESALLGFLSTHGISSAAPSETLAAAYQEMRGFFEASKDASGDTPAMTDETRKRVAGLRAVPAPEPVTGSEKPVTGEVPPPASVDSSLVPVHPTEAVTAQPTRIADEQTEAMDTAHAGVGAESPPAAAPAATEAAAAEAEETHRRRR